ncbi:MAG: hypothetical protein HOP11_03220 [Saprospiraceae bacterium]|nr:hypothetical protein [Saprospiraceae bacterium]
MNQEQEYLPEILSTLKGKNPFRCPAGYFDNKPDYISNQLDFLVVRQLGFSTKNVFKTPKDYFENTSEATLQLIQLERSLRDLDYKVPNQYFENLGNRVITQIKNQDSESKVIKVQFRYRRLIAVAAMVLFIVGFYFLRNINSSVSNDFNLSQIDDETLIEFVASQDLDLQNFSEIMDEQSITEINIQQDPSLEESELNDIIDNF